MVKREIKQNDLILDISTYNLITDYSKVKNLCAGVVIRIGYRGYDSGGIVKDKRFDKHVAGLINELPIGIYFLDQSIKEIEAIFQADWVYEQLIKSGLKDTQFPIWLDSEWSGYKYKKGRGDLITSEQRTKNVLAFCNRMNDLGYLSGIYASDSWLRDKLNYSLIKHLPIWNAKYGDNDGKIGLPPTRRNDMHQFTSKYMTDFCISRLDMSVVRNTDIFKQDQSKIPIVSKYTVPARTIKITDPLMQGDDVKWIQSKLGFTEKDIDGYYGKITEKAVKEFQQSHNLLVDGVVGKKTIAKLTEVV